ncbi:MAG: hypothetical protein ACHP7H_00645 [Hyphomicrobiales bacterium]
MTASYVVVRSRGASLHAVIPFDGTLTGFDARYEYAIGPFKREIGARTFAAFANKAVGAFDLLSKAFRMASKGKAPGAQSPAADADPEALPATE